MTHYIIHLHLPGVKECQYVTVDPRGITLAECILLSEAIPFAAIQDVTAYLVHQYKPELVTAIPFEAAELTDAQKKLLKIKE